jgi:hypothetical protein
MKIKQDFVTNSSSVCYVVCLPQKKEWILENVDVESDDDEELSASSTPFGDVITLLLRGEPIWEQEQQMWFGSIRNFCQKNNFVITEFEVGSERGQMVNLIAEDVDKMAGILGIDWIKEVTNGRRK